MAKAAITAADVTALAPELGGTAFSDQAWTDILTYVNEFDATEVPDASITPESTQTDRMAKIFLAAHIATMAKQARKGAAGPVTAEAVGGVRRSYGLIATGGESSSFASTRYGQLYLEVVRSSSVSGPMLV